MPVLFALKTPNEKTECNDHSNTTNFFHQTNAMLNIKL